MGKILTHLYIEDGQLKDYVDQVTWNINNAQITTADYKGNQIQVLKCESGMVPYSNKISGSEGYWDLNNDDFTIEFIYYTYRSSYWSNHIFGIACKDDIRSWTYGYKSGGDDDTKSNYFLRYDIKPSESKNRPLNSWTPNQWYHVVITRKKDHIYAFQNGILDLDFIVYKSTKILEPLETSGIVFGQYPNGDDRCDFLLKEFRIIKGSCLYSKPGFRVPDNLITYKTSINNLKLGD